LASSDFFFQGNGHSADFRAVDEELHNFTHCRLYATNVFSFVETSVDFPLKLTTDSSSPAL
jgi:hypothetical protein